MARERSGKAAGRVTLAIDIGGTGVKMMALSERGKALSDRVRVPTPHPPTPRNILKALDGMKTGMPAFHHVSVGFPGVIKEGKTMTAANLEPEWIGFPLEKTLARKWRKPVRVCNDCAVQGYGAIQGRGVELVLTLGTGLGSALFTGGHLCPGLELGHHPWRKKTYEDYLGKRGLEKYGAKHWNRLLKQAIEQTRATLNWDTLYLGGGNAKKVKLGFDDSIRIIPNEDGLIGGIALWREHR